jgi:hypothetical protein
MFSRIGSMLIFRLTPSIPFSLAQLDLGVPSPHTGLPWLLPVYNRAIAKLWVLTPLFIPHRQSRVRGWYSTQKPLNSGGVLDKHL